MANRKTRAAKQIRRFLEQPPKKSQRWLAAELGVAPSTVNDWITGRRAPGRNLAVTVQELTGAQVSDWS